MKGESESPSLPKLSIWGRVLCLKEEALTNHGGIGGLSGENGTPHSRLFSETFLDLMQAWCDGGAGRVSSSSFCQLQVCNARRPQGRLRNIQLTSRGQLQSRYIEANLTKFCAWGL